MKIFCAVAGRCMDRAPTRIGLNRSTGAMGMRTSLKQGGTGAAPTRKGHFPVVAGPAPPCPSAPPPSSDTDAGTSGSGTIHQTGLDSPGGDQRIAWGVSLETRDLIVQAGRPHHKGAPRQLWCSRLGSTSPNRAERWVGGRPYDPLAGGGGTQDDECADGNPMKERGSRDLSLRGRW